ncbi:hypothetical protein N7470_006653 [Penicillium chermesinum]|nr:hypothetical protein N7470_006653 [Penicillium chermesinum]
MSSSDPPKEYTTRAWLVIMGAFTCAFCTVGFLNSFGIFEEYYASNQLAGSPQSTIAWLGAISIFFLFLISAVAGALLDAFGPTILVCTGSLGTVLSVMMTSLCHQFWQFFLAQGVLLGISMSLVTWPCLGLVGQYIKRKRAVAMGIVLGGSSLGGIVWPIAINQLLQKPNIGFGWTMRIVGFIMIPLLAFTCIVCKSPPPPPPPTREEGGSMKRTDGDVEIHEKGSPTRKEEIKVLLKQPALQLTCVSMFVIYLSMFSPFFYATSYATKMGFSSELSFYTVSIVNGASFFGRVLPGLLADKYGKFNCCIVSTIAAGIVALCWTKATTVAGLVIWCAAYGFASGGIISLQQACAAQVSTPGTLGLSIGTVVGSSAFSAMANVPVSGALAEKYGYLALSLYSGVPLLVGGILLIFARLVQDRRLLAVVSD